MPTKAEYQLLWSLSAAFQELECVKPGLVLTELREPLPSLDVSGTGMKPPPVLRQQRVFEHLPHQDAIRAEADLCHSLRLTLRSSGL